MAKVIKRDCTEAEFDKTKISSAILKAMHSSGIVDEGIANEIADEICAETNIEDEISIYDIEQMVFDKLITKDQRLTARAYEGYRSVREFQRDNENTIDDQIEELLGGTNDYWNNENSNKNARLVTTQRDYMAGILSTDITRRFLLPPDVVQAHDEGILHFHDADYFAQRTLSNCCLCNLEDMLQHGTCINKVMIEKPHRFITAMTIATQIITAVTSSQYGGITVSLTHLAPFIRDSYQWHKKKYLDWGIDPEKAEIFAERDTKREVTDGVQTFNYQCNSMTTTNGQAPFLSVFMYLDETEEYRPELAMLIEEFLIQRIQGMKNQQGVYVTPAFPKLLYVLDEDNIHEDSPYWYLTELAAECTAKRMVPDYISAKVMRETKIDKNGNGNVYGCMGCVSGDSMITYDYKGKHGELMSAASSFSSMWEEMSEYFSIKPQTDLYPSADPRSLYMDLEDVTVLDPVIHGYTECKRIIRNVSDEWVQVCLSDEKCLCCTPDHPFETKDDGIVLARDLVCGKTQILTDNHSGGSMSDMGVKFFSLAEYCDKEYAYETVIECKPIHKTDYSYDLTTESGHFVVEGIYTHNCRSFLTPYINKEGNPQYYGRFNQGVVTINLPDIALSSGGDMDTFWKIFEERTELCHKALQCRHRRLEGTVSDVAPILWQDGAFTRLKQGETIDEYLHNGYSTISLGYAGLYECVKYMTGVSHSDPEVGMPFGLKVMQALNDKCKQWKEAEHIDYSLYGSPIESTTYKFAKCLKKRFGVIEGITDRDYITNSYHIPVFEEIDPFEKLAIEAKFQKLSPGGAISYVETADMTHNTEAVLQVMRFIYDNIMYAELNTKSDYCQACGYDGEIKIIDEGGELIWECPNCGNRNKDLMNVARRTCGYIGTNFWNAGRTQEIKERFVHLDDHEAQLT